LRSLSFEADSDAIGYVSDTNASKVLNKVMVEAQKNAEEESGSSSNEGGQSRKKSITIISGRNVIEQKVTPR